MRRVSHINPKLQLTRVNADRSEDDIGRHAFIRAGDKIRAVSSVVSYGDIGYEVEFISGDKRVGMPWFISLDIAKGHSRERMDVFTMDAFTTVSKKERFDYERHKHQLDVERRRGVWIGWNDRRIKCLFGPRGREREYQDGGFDVKIDATLVASIRQFSVNRSLNLPSPKDKVEYDGERFLIESISRDIAALTLNLSRDRASKE